MTTNRPKFQRAERKRVKLKIAITGPSGAGKTYSALELATGIAGPEGKIAFIDTENDSASLYSDRFVFDTLNIDPPYTVGKYIEAIKAAQEEKYDVVVIDSISHAWAGDGGLLAKKEAMDARGGNQFANWGTITKEQEQFKAHLLNADIHMITTMRSKQEYTQVGDGGKLKVQKLGLAPIQRDGMEYEFTTVFDVAMDHMAAVSKDRTGLFGDNIHTITKETGEKLINWLNGAKVDAAPSPKVEAPVTTPAAEPKESRKINEKQRNLLYKIKDERQIPDEVCKKYLEEMGVASSKDLTWGQFDNVLKRMRSYVAPKAEAGMSEEEIQF